VFRRFWPNLPALRTRPLGSTMEKTQAQGDMVIVRFADDFVVGFEHRQEPSDSSRNSRTIRAVWPGTASRQDTAHRICRHADKNRRDRGDGKPESFNFLGFTHISGKTRKGWFTVLRQTMRQRWQAKVQAVRIELKRRLHDPVPKWAPTCGSSSRGTTATTGAHERSRARRLPKRNRSHLAMDA